MGAKSKAKRRACANCDPSDCDALWEKVERALNADKRKDGGGAHGVLPRVREQLHGSGPEQLRFGQVGKAKKSGAMRSRSFDYKNVWGGHQDALQASQKHLGNALDQYETQCKDDKHKKEREDQRKRARRMAGRKPPSNAARQRAMRMHFSRSLRPLEGGQRPTGAPTIRMPRPLGGGGGGGGAGMIMLQLLM